MFRGKINENIICHAVLTCLFATTSLLKKKSHSKNLSKYSHFILRNLSTDCSIQICMNGISMLRTLYD